MPNDEHRVRQYARDGLVFDVLDEGPEEAAEVVMLLHGFPQSGLTWGSVVPALHAAGLRTLAPDLRGYSPRARPSARSAYRMREIAADVVALVDAAQVSRAHVVGHDWGGAAAWATAGLYRDRVSSLTVLSTPHPAALAWSFTHSRQALKSWYMAAFALPYLPERVVPRGLRSSLVKSGLPAPIAQEYAARMADPAALAGALGWYRGIASSLHDHIGRTRVPTTYAWGRRDVALGRAAAEATARFVDAAYLFVELEAGHWLPERYPDEVASLVLDRVASA
ncbi:MAG: alpha/beta fold hydrolase [Actinomycetales bacterium]